MLCVLHLLHLLHLLQRQPHLRQIGYHLALKVQRKDRDALEKLLGQGGAVDEVVQEADLVQHQPWQVLGVLRKNNGRYLTTQNMATKKNANPSMRDSTCQNDYVLTKKP